jgi:hypothetical protein
MLPNVPRTITSWLPRLEPNELKSRRGTSWPIRNWPAGAVGGIEPAGEMWSVVTLSPSDTRTRAPAMSPRRAGDGPNPSK